MGQRTRNSILYGGQSYSRSLSWNIPNGVAGDYYIIIVADGNNNVANDTNRTDNITVYPIHIEIPPTPDLMVASFTAPTSAFAGEQIAVNFTIANQGDGAATGSWHEAAWIASTPNLAGGYQTAVSYTHLTLPTTKQV